MMLRRRRNPRAAYVAQAPVVMQMRCPCPICRRLDAEYPGEGYQLALFPYRVGVQ